MEFYVLDYQDESGEWRNTDEGDAEPTTEEIEASSQISIGFQDVDNNWHYRWVDGPFDEDFWIEDAIDEILNEYNIVAA